MRIFAQRPRGGQRRPVDRESIAKPVAKLAAYFECPPRTIFRETSVEKTFSLHVLVEGRSTCDLPFQFLKCLLVGLGRSQRNLFLWLVVDQEMPQLGQ